MRWQALILTCAFEWTRAIGAEPLPGNADFEAQARVVQLLQTVIQDYWTGAENKTGAKTNSTANYTNVESAFREASRLMPARLDLRYGLASALVGQAVQTNGIELKNKLTAALRVYQEIKSLDANAFEAPLLCAAVPAGASGFVAVPRFRWRVPVASP